MRRLLVGALTMATAVGTLTAAAGPAQARPRGVAAYDFNGDGRQDLAIGDPTARVGGHARAGAVFVVPGASRGTASRAVTFSEDTRGLPTRSGTGDRFGTVLASADFNGDHRADLAVGIPDKKVGNRHGAGAVAVFNGSKHGLTGTLSRLLLGPARSGHHGGNFGQALAAADFNGDGYADLAIGGQGQVTIVFGSKHGLRATHTVQFGTGTGGGIAAGDVNGDGHPDLVTSSGFCLGSSQGPRSCTALSLGSGPKVVADVTGDGFADAVVGHPGSASGRGNIVLYRGSATGLVPAAMPLSESSASVPGAGAAGDHFGASLAAVDVTGDGRADVAVGVPGRRGGRGGLDVLHGAPAGFAANGAMFIAPPRGGHRGNRFGAALRWLDLNGDHHPDLVVGAPGTSHGRGGVLVIPGKRHGLRLNDVTALTPGALGVSARHFGAVLGG